MRDGKLLKTEWKWEGYRSKHTYGTVNSVPDSEPEECTVYTAQRLSGRQQYRNKCWVLTRWLYVGYLYVNRRPLLPTETESTSIIFADWCMCVCTKYVTIWLVTHEWHICITFQQHESHSVHDVFEHHTGSGSLHARFLNDTFFDFAIRHSCMPRCTVGWT